MRILVFIFCLLISFPAYASKDFAKRYPNDTAMEVYTPNNPPPSGSGSGTVGIGTTGLVPVYVGVTTVGPSNKVYIVGGNVGINSSQPTQKLDVGGSINASGNIGIGTTMICTGKGCPAKDIDVFLTVGQSNSQGDAALADAQANSPIPLAGTAYQYYSSTISPLVDPVGNATYGSAWPQFAITYNQQTGHMVAIVPAAKGGTSMWGGTGDASGCWDDVNYPSDCTLQRASITALNAALAAFTSAGYNPIFRGVLWCQGEADATYINAGLEVQSDYITALQSMIAQYRTDEGATVPFYIFRTGTASADINAAQQQYRSVRNAQEYVASQDPLTSIVFSGAATFPSRGLMQVANSPHYTQAGYNIMGEIGAQNVVGENQQNKAMYQQGLNMIFPTNIGIGTSTPVGLGTTLPVSQVSIRSPNLTGRMLTLIDSAGTNLENHTADGVVYFKGNVGIGDPTPGNLLSVLASSANIGVGTWVQMSSLLTVAETGQRFFMGQFQGTANTSAGQTVTEIDGQSTNAINSGSGTLTTGIGNNASVQLTGSGNVGIAQPIKAQVTNSGSGTLTNGYPLYSRCLNSGSGTFVTCAQLYLDTNTGSYTNLFGVDQIDSAAKNYFAGNVGINSVSPGQFLDVQGTARATNVVDTGVTASSLVATDSNKQLTAVTLTTTGSSGPSTFTSGTLNIPQYSGAAAAAGGTNAVQYNSGSSTTAGAENIFSMNGTNVGVNTVNAHASLEVVQSGSNTPLMVSSTSSSIGDVLIVTSGGNVGIGTIVPQNYNSIGNNFVIAGSGNRGLQIAGGSTSNETILLGSTVNPTNGRLAYGNSNNVMSFFTNNTQKMTLTSGGNLGLGTTVLPNKLAIVGNIGIGTGTSSSFTLTSAPSGGMIVEGNTGIGVASPLDQLDVSGRLRISGTGAFASTTSALYNSATLGLVIQPKGGSTNDFYITDTTGNGMLIARPAAASALQLIDNTAYNVGIFQANPQARLDVNGSAKVAGQLRVTGTNVIRLGDDSNVAFQSSTATGGDLEFFLGGPETVRFTSGGNVGIGTITPGKSLDVQGSIRISSLGSSLTITQGSNSCAGQSTLSSGTVTVSTTCAPSSSKGIFLTDAGGGVLANIGSLSVGTIVGGTSFVINSSNALDSSAVNWEIHGI